jgi:hypothetical protein
MLYYRWPGAVFTFLERWVFVDVGARLHRAQPRERAAAVGGHRRTRAHERVYGDVARGARPGAAARRVRVVAGAQRLCRALLRAGPRAARSRELWHEPLLQGCALAQRA